MKAFLLAIVLMVSSAEVVFASAGRAPNILCRWAFFENSWHVLPAYVPAYRLEDQILFGNIFGTYSDPGAPGFGICTSRNYDESYQMIAFKMFTYRFEKPFQTAPGTCEVATTGPYEEVEKLKVVPMRGLSSELTMKRDDGTALKFINYFMTVEEESSWAKDLRLPAQKCAELFQAGGEKR